MTNPRLLKHAWIFILLIVCISSCEEPGNDNKQEIEINKIVVNDMGEFSFQDSLTYIVSNGIQYQIKIETNPTDATIYFSFNGDNYKKLAEDWINIDTTLSVLEFYAQKPGYNNTDIKRLDFGFGNDSTIQNIDLYPNPFIDEIFLKIESDKLRGQLDYTIYDAVGKTIMQNSDFVSSDSFEKKLDLSDLEPGIYILKLEIGNTIILKKLVRN